VFVGLMASVAIFFLVRVVRGPSAFEAVIALFSFAAIGACAFLLGRAHARGRRDRRNPPPPGAG
jgi:hypothetical protein